MTPGERDRDLKLAKSLKDLAKIVEKRSSKIALVMNQCADRMLALSYATPISASADPTVNTPFAKNQPASTPDKQKLDPVRD